MFAILIASLFVSVAAHFTWLAAQTTLIQSLRDFYPRSYASAGAPQMNYLWESGGFNYQWSKYVLLRRFSRDPNIPRSLLSTFEVAFWSGWVRFAATLMLLVVLAIILVQHGA